MEKNQKEEITLDAIRKIVRETVKEEISDFKEEMLDFKEEMTGFKKEMTDFKSNTEGFINEMRLFRLETRENFEKINKKLGDLDTVKNNQTAIINSIRSNAKDIGKFKEVIPIIEEKA